VRKGSSATSRSGRTTLRLSSPALCEKADGLLKRLKDDGISPFIATQIVNVMPESVDELRMIFMAESKPMIPSELEKILTVVSTFRG
jgi:DNA-directed RNA polymerase subunit F